MRSDIIKSFLSRWCKPTNVVPIFCGANILNCSGTNDSNYRINTVPVFIGMIIRRFAENFISSKINIINKLTSLLFIIVFAAIWIEEKDNILNYLAQAGLAVLILNVVMMLIAYFIAKKFVSGIAQQKCIALECGLQNGTLAVFVATLMFDDIAYVIPTAAYALTMYVTGFIFIYILKKSN